MTNLRRLSSDFALLFLSNSAMIQLPVVIFKKRTLYFTGESVCNDDVLIFDSELFGLATPGNNLIGNELLLFLIGTNGTSLAFSELETSGKVNGTGWVSIIGSSLGLGLS